MALRPVGGGGEADLDTRAVTDEHDITGLDQLEPEPPEPSPSRPTLEANEMVFVSGALVEETDEEFDRWATHSARRLNLAASAAHSPPGTARLPGELHLGLAALEAQPRENRTFPAASAPKSSKLVWPSAWVGRPRRAMLLGVLALAVMCIAVIIVAASGLTPKRSSPRIHQQAAIDESESKPALIVERAPHRLDTVPRTRTTPHSSRRTGQAERRETRHAAPAPSYAGQPRTNRLGGSVTLAEQTTVSDVSKPQQAAPQQPHIQQQPVQQASAQQTSLQPVHYQAPAQPTGPKGLGGQVGNDCNPKCS